MYEEFCAKDVPQPWGLRTPASGNNLRSVVSHDRFSPRRLRSPRNEGTIGAPGGVAEWSKATVC
jgi:hypothetical protein